MPSFKFIAVIATAILAAAPSLAQTPPRGRPNHADQYGYPHGLAKPAPGTPRQRITPGGYVDSRPANQGAQCRFNNQCVTPYANSRAICQTDGTCGFQCLGNTMFDGNSCAGMIEGNRCSFDRQCPTSVDNATGLCYDGRCSYRCDFGFRPEGSTCVPSARSCGGVDCPSVPGGYSTCDATTNQCVATCDARLGFRQFCNADNTSCRCINTDTDLNNCGTPGNVCPQGYNGKGQAYCSNRTCQLSCNRLSKVTPRDGSAPYCV